MRFSINLFFVAALSVFSALALPATAQLAGQELPDLSGLQELFGAVASGETEVEEVRGDDGLLGSGIVVPDTGARGNMAKALGELVGQQATDPELAVTLEKAFFDASVSVEDGLAQIGFQKRDYGVGFALFFILSWEMANQVTLEFEASKAAGANIIQTVQAAYDDGQQDTDPEVLDASYDMFLTIPVALLTLVTAYEEQDRMEEAAQMREFAAGAFEQIVGRSPYDIDITDTGEIVGY